jgi:hypothetical protein
MFQSPVGLANVRDVFIEIEGVDENQVNGVSRFKKYEVNRKIGGDNPRPKRLDQNVEGGNERPKRDQSGRKDNRMDRTDRVRTEEQIASAKEKREANTVIFKKGLVAGKEQAIKKKSTSKKPRKGLQLSIFAGPDGNSESITSQKFVPIDSEVMIKYLAEEWRFIVVEGTSRVQLEEQYLNFKQYVARQSSLETPNVMVGGIRKRKEGQKKRGDGMYQSKRRKNLLKHKENEFVTLLESPDYEKVFMKVATKRFRDKYFSTMDLLRAMDGSSTNTMNLSAVEMFKELTKLNPYEKGIVPSQALMSFDAHALEIAMELLVPGMYFMYITYDYVIMFIIMYVYICSYH